MGKAVMLPKESKFRKHYVPFTKKSCRGLGRIKDGRNWRGRFGSLSSGKPGGCSATLTTRGQHGWNITSHLAFSQGPWTHIC